MAERRPLVEGLKGMPDLEEQFVYGKKKAPAQRGTGEPQPVPPVVSVPPPQAAVPAEPKKQPLSNHGRVPFTTRVRQDIASALKRASLERQLAGVHPNTLQEILETALEPWLRENGYLP
jgi:hypothetical protein